MKKYKGYKYFAKFLVRRDGKIFEALGTDSEFRLDGRVSVFVMRYTAIDRLKELKAIRPDYVGLKIIRKYINDSGKIVREDIPSYKTDINIIYYKEEVSHE